MSKTIGERIVEGIDSNTLMEQGGDGCSWIDSDIYSTGDPLAAEVLTKFIQGDPAQKCFDVGHDIILDHIEAGGEHKYLCLRCGEEF